MSSILAQLILNGIIAGSIYALVASGFSLVYSIQRFLHLAHGTVITVGAFAMYSFFAVWGLNFVVALVLTILVCIVLVLLMNYLVYKPMRKRKASGAGLLIASLGIFIFLQALVIAIYGADIKTLGIRLTGKYNILGAILTQTQLIIIVTSIVIMIGLWWFMKKTRMGKAMRATADNKEIAPTVGINPERIYLYSYIVSAVIAGIAAVLIALEQNLEPNMGFSLIIKGLTGAIIGGVGSVHGAVLGSLLLGIVENLGIWFLPSGYKDAIAFMLLFGFLLFRPQGILGVKK